MSSSYFLVSTLSTIDFVLRMRISYRMHKRLPTATSKRQRTYTSPHMSLSTYNPNPSDDVLILHIVRLTPQPGVISEPADPQHCSILCISSLFVCYGLFKSTAPDNAFYITASDVRSYQKTSYLDLRTRLTMSSTR